MRNAWNSFAHFIHTRIGWNRIGFLASLAVLCLAGIMLFRMLRDINPERVLAAAIAMPASHIALCALFVTGAYVTLTCYDFFSLRTIGACHVPYRIAAMAAFTSYSIGHNLGATVFTGGAIRFRIYSAYGLSIVDVAKIAFVTGLTFWLGNAFVLGLGMAISPEAASALDRMPPSINQAIGVFVLFVIGFYLVWLLGGTREVGVKGVAVVLPNASLTLVQIMIGVLDLGLSALGMYMLLPADPAAELLPFVVIFVLATLLGFISHTPGALGVFDAAILLALPQYTRAELLATLVVFRMIYYVIPFTLALCTMAAREFWLASRGRKPDSRTAKGSPAAGS